MRKILIRALFCLLAPAGAGAQTPAQDARAPRPPFAVEARNLTVPENCAEKDNVQIDLVSPLVRSFRIKAVHPAYIGTIATDRWAPDFTACDFHPGGEYFADGAERVTIWETPRAQFVGYRLKHFWRPAAVPVRVGDRRFTGLHVVQLYLYDRERLDEALVFYPPDGYWRARPLPFGDMRWTAYGSSFLIGPVEISERPIVDLKEIAFDPESRTFALAFRRGGGARVKIETVDSGQFSLGVTMDGATPGGLPFATLRSMYASETNSDAARLAWREPGAVGWKETDMFGLKTAPVSEIWIGRRLPSRHNTSAPDMIFSDFAP